MHEEVPKAEQGEEEEDVEQGETQFSPLEGVGLSQLLSNNSSPITSPLTISERGRIPSTQYSESEYILLTEEGEPESFQDAVSHQDKENWL